MSYKKVAFQMKNFFVFIFLAMFSIFASSLVTIIPVIGNMSNSISFVLSLMGMMLILIVGFLFINKLKIRGKEEIFNKKKIGLYAVGYIALQVSGYSFLFFQSNMESARSVTFLSELNNIPGILLFLSAAIVGPITEEIVFRGFVIGYWLKDKPVIGIIVSSIAFSLFHAKENIFIILMYFFSSVIYGLVYIKSKRLEGSIILHILNNLPGAISML